MRIELPREALQLGGNVFYAVQKAYELCSGPQSEPAPHERHFVIKQYGDELLYDIEGQMAIVVPMRNERLRLLEGILFAIPHPCLIIAVSNSPRSPIDRYITEVQTIDNCRTYAKKHVLIVHQKDPAVARAFAAGGYPQLLDSKGLVKDGKAEGMIIGTMLALLAGRKYVGFVDADNYFPGSIFEYVTAFAAGFAQSRSPYSMVRLLWHSKPKIVDSDLYFAKYGRTSAVTNNYLNRLLGCHKGAETEVIKTGNAGEHAMSLALATLLDYAPGYAVETNHFVSLFEQFGGMRESRCADAMRQRVELFQIETRNPHLHESKGEEHVGEMINDSLSVIHQSFTCPESVRKEIRKELRRRHLLSPRTDLPPCRLYPPLNGIDLAQFKREVSGAKWASEILEGPAKNRRTRKKAAAAKKA